MATPAKKTAAKRTYAGKKAAASPKKKSQPKKSPGYRGEKGKGYQPKKKPGGKKGGNKGPKRPSVADYLMGDPNYQAGVSDLDWALEQYLLENEAAEGDVQASFDSALGYMNFDKTKDLDYMKQDYGARGIQFSGLYPEAVSDYNTEWSMGAADLNRDLASQMRDLGFEKQNMKQSTQMQKRDLRLDAIRRRKEEIQSNQFNNKAGYGGGRKNQPGGKKKQPAKKTAAAPRKTGVRKSGRR
jgi:hypothetical protein